VTSYDFDARNRLTYLAAVSPIAGMVSSYAYTLAPTGNRTRIEEQDGTTRSYGYDPLYRLTEERVTSAPTPGSPTLWRNAFGYDPVGNRLTQERTERTGETHTVVYGYDPRDRLLTEDTTAYGWDENGNLTSKSGPEDALYVWDDENRLTAVNLANGTVIEHTYDVDGTRIRTRTTPATGPPTTVDYLVDPGHQTSAAGRGLVLSQVVAESDEAGSVTAYHVRGDDLLATLRPNPTPPPGGSPWTARYFHAEGIGTIRALTDEQGNVTDRYTLEAFGTLLSHEGDDPNAYLFAGEPFDPNSGFYYNRARWLDPNAGRFVSRDSIPGRPFEPGSLHKYLYSGARPNDTVDPTGLSEFSLGGQLASIAVRASLEASTLLAALGSAFLRGDYSRVGRLFQQFGVLAEQAALEVISLYPQVQASAVSLGARLIDYGLRFRDRFALLECKFSIPRQAGPALDRLVGQVTSGLAQLPRLAGDAQRARFVLWSLREISARQLSTLQRALGPSFDQIDLRSGVYGLHSFIVEFFGL